MKRITPLLLLLCMSTLAVAQQVSARLDSLMDYYNRRNMFNGSVLVVMKGQPLLSKGYGLRNAEGTVKTTKTVFSSWAPSLNRLRLRSSSNCRNSAS
ncbi:hypothetical protein MKQ70_00980 [Chitinophaga sedimenti]|uniref:hypothetical protein n=1 Tax=Chitinophaga sedimenti TaxID=2033606 RepID=UPI002004ED55|nr:hypothetical protein [Chitinophaga sedimenti]MCK7553649.1 hypothetical protein [Chitinophaga sedimenti]